ncbi:hypothetical protein IP70_01175 [alpha proteobacterium AAP38]|nr:hypothetical protein IP70_01175 [alpha proteobacterium AAP38]
MEISAPGVFISGPAVYDPVQADGEQVVTGVENSLTDLAATLAHILAGGMEEPIFDADVWVRMEELAGTCGKLVAAGADPTPFAAALDRVPRHNAREETLYHLLRAMALWDADAATRVIEILTADLESGQPRHSLIQADYILRAMIFGVWTNRIKLADPGAHDMAIRRLWHAMLNQYRAAMPARDPVPAHARQRDLIVITTGQFIRGAHQPSTDMLDFVTKLVLRLGRRVVLVNTADGPVKSYFPYLGNFVSSVDRELAAGTKLVIDGLPIPFIHLPLGFTDPQMASEARDQILALKPDLVLSFGTLCPVSDLCRGLLDVVAIPYGSYLPFAEPTWLALPRPLNPGETPALAVGGLTPDRVIRIEYSYAPPPAMTVRNKAALGLGDDTILTLIIGLRLAREVTPDFAAALDAAVQAEPRLFFLFVGQMDNYADLVAPHPALAARSRSQGHETDVMGLMAAADLYINPPRGGGGTSAAYALSRGIPAYSLNSGDVGVVVGPAFHLSSYADFAPATTRYTDDPDLRGQLQEKAKARFAEISSRERMLRQILDGVKAMRAKG